MTSEQRSELITIKQALTDLKDLLGDVTDVIDRTANSARLPGALHDKLRVMRLEAGALCLSNAISMINSALSRS